MGGKDVDRAERKKLGGCVWRTDISVNTLAKEPFSLLPSSCKSDAGNVVLFMLLIYFFFQLSVFLHLNFDLELVLILCNCSYLVAV